MLQLIQILGLPLLACIIMGSILGYLGIHVLKREVIFIDIALAQVAAVGAIAAHLAFAVHGNSLLSYLCSMGAILLVAAFYAMAQRKIIQISLEAIIGISYAIAAAAALFLVGIAPGGHSHIQQILSGSLLWVSWNDVIFCLIIFSAVALCLFLFRKPLMELSNNYQQNQAPGSKSALWDFTFYILLGIVITIAVQIAGIVVVFACLIIPATISAFFSSRGPVRMFIICTVIITASIAGLLFAYFLDFSVGPAIALFLGCELIITSLLKMVTVHRTTTSTKGGFLKTALKGQNTKAQGNAPGKRPLLFFKP
ncbi:MAG: metal ABC transporter permease [Sedimentisphaerales bacterium]|nr:metal ABC transporter permease [Sedimentisphaerales bacterium]